MKTFKKTFKFICEECGEFSHTKREYCDKCGAKALRKAIKDDFAKYEKKKKADDEKRLAEKAKINVVKGANGNQKNGYDLYQEITQKQKIMENTEENLEKYKKYQQALKSILTQLIIKRKGNTPVGIQREKSNENRNILEGEIKMVDLIVETYEIRRGVQKLDSEYKELVAKDREGEFVSDLLKSNRIEVELLNKQDKENSDIIKELLKEQNEKKMEYRRKWVEENKKLGGEQEVKDVIKNSPKAPERRQKMWDKAFPRSFENFRIFGLGSKAHHMGDFKGAVRYFKKVVGKEPDASFGWYMLLECLSYLGKWEEMIEVGDKALKLHPNFGPSYSWIGDAYNQLGKQKQAMDCYKKGCGYSEKDLILIDKKLVKYPQDVTLHATLLNSLGEINIRLGNYEEAIKYNKRAFKIHPDEHNLHSLGLAYKEMGDYDNAIEYLKRSLDVNPKHSYAWFDLGLIYEDSNDSKKAIECFEKAVESSPQWVKLREKLVEVKPDSLALLKEVPNIGIHFDETIAQRQTKSDLIIKEIREIENILKDSGITAEEKKYFKQRKLKLTKDLQLIKTPKTQAEERSRTRDKSLFPPISELIQKKPFVKDKPPLPDKDKLNKLRENFELSRKAGERAESMIKTLEKIVKNDEEYKILLLQKEEGKSVEDLIKQNRKYAKILAQKNKEKSMEFKKWQQSEEGKKILKLLEESHRIAPNLDNDIRLVYGLKIANESKKNDDEYEELIERRNQGEFVDDLIKQNLYKAKVLAEQNKKVWEEEDRRIKPITQEDWQDNQEENEKKQYCTICGKDEAAFLICTSCYKMIITKFMEILDEERKVLEDLMKNDKEYKFLLERRDSGEPVEDLINQNRYQAKILAEKDKKNIEKISDIQVELGNKGKKNEEEYEELLERRNNGENVDDLIKQNRNIRKIIIKQINKFFGEVHSQGLKMKLDAKSADEERKLQAIRQVELMSGKLGKNIQDFLKNNFEYKDLLKRAQMGEDVEDLIKQNRINAEVIRTSGMKVQFEKKEWLKMYPDGFQWFQDPIGQQLFLDFFQIGKEKKKKKSQKCPNCRIRMGYLEYLDAYQCPKCKNKFFIWEKKLVIFGHINKA